MTENDQPPATIDDLHTPMHSASELFAADAHRAEETYLEVETVDEAGEDDA